MNHLFLYNEFCLLENNWGYSKFLLRQQVCSVRTEEDLPENSYCVSKSVLWEPRKIFLKTLTESASLFYALKAYIKSWWRILIIQEESDSKCSRVHVLWSILVRRWSNIEAMTKPHWTKSLTFTWEVKQTKQRLQIIWACSGWIDLVWSARCFPLLTYITQTRLYGDPK